MMSHELALLLHQRLKKYVADGNGFNAEKLCFKEQVEFIRDPSKRKVACNSRRSGKTFACAVDLIETCLTNPGVNCLYITLSRLNAKRIIWKELCDLCHRYSLPAEINHTELSIAFMNKAVAYLAGAKDEAEIEKFRGIPLKKAYLDEAQSFKSYIGYLIDDVLSPALYDHDGSLILLGTPNATKSGTFYDAYHQKDRFKGWKSFHWTIYNNPFIEKKAGKSVEKLIEEDLERKGYDKNHPTFIREILGEWVEDSTCLVYKYNQELNTYEELPKGCHFNYVLGIDLGWEDADALVVWAYTEDDPNLYLVHDEQKSKMTITALAQRIKQLGEKFPISKSVIDTGGLGKKITEELATRFQINLHPAEKIQKLQYIELMNDDFRKGAIKVKKSAGIVDDWKLLQWDTDSDTPKEDDRFDNHRPDAALYSYRECRHFTHREKPKTVERHQDKWAEEFWNKEEKRLKQFQQELQDFHDVF